MFGESPIAIPLSFENTKYPLIEERMEKLFWNREEALAAHEFARSRMIDWRKSTFVPFKKGDKVWLDSRNLKTTYHKKMKPKLEREGPFPITDVLGLVLTDWNFRHLGKSMMSSTAGLLQPYKENEVYGKNFTEPPPNLVEGEEVYKVETILNHRKREWGYQYFVKWQGYPIFDALWEPEHSFSDDGDTLAQYKLRHHLWQNVISPCLSIPSTTWTGNMYEFGSFVWNPRVVWGYKNWFGNGGKYNRSLGPTFWPIQSHRKILNCWHVFHHLKPLVDCFFIYHLSSWIFSPDNWTQNDLFPGQGICFQAYLYCYTTLLLFPLLIHWPTRARS